MPRATIAKVDAKGQCKLQGSMLIDNALEDDDEINDFCTCLYSGLNL